MARAAAPESTFQSYAGILVTAPGIDQAAAGFYSTSMPSANLTPVITFGN
jgi:hypothetical protein